MMTMSVLSVRGGAAWGFIHPYKLESASLHGDDREPNWPHACGLANCQVIRPMQIRAIFLLLAVVAGCGPASGRSAEQPSEAPQPPAVEWRREGLETQPRISDLHDRVPPELDFVPGTTPWRTLDPPAPAATLDTVRGNSPGEAAARLALAMGWSVPLGEDLWEQTIRVWRESDDRALAVVLLWGFQDDAVAGQDLRVRLVRRNGQWVAQEVDERFHCRRRVDPSGLCL